MNSKLILSRINEYELYTLLEDDKVVEFRSNEEDDEKILGNIYLAKINNLVSNINSAFVEISNNELCYLNLNEADNPYVIRSVNKNKLCCGDLLLVQVAKEWDNDKKCVVRTDIELAGELLVLKMNANKTSFSSKISDNNIKAGIRALLAEYTDDSFNFIVRTNAAAASFEDISNEACILKEKLEEIKKKAQNLTNPTLICSSNDSLTAFFNDINKSALNEIIAEDTDLFIKALDLVKNKGSLKNYDKKVAKNLVTCELSNRPLTVREYDLSIPINSYYKISKALSEVNSSHIWLKSGANIVIEPTEAMTVIDVNSAKSVKKKNTTEKHFLNVNLEATDEIFKQIRLRNISGIIVIDYIDLNDIEDDNDLIKYIKEKCALMSVKTEYIEMTKLHLVEITRQKVRKPFYENKIAKFIKSC